MHFSLPPFPNHPPLPAQEPREPGPDLRAALASRPAPRNRRAIPNAALVETIVESLRDVTMPFYVTHCHEEGGDLHLSVAAAKQGYHVTPGDEIRGGLYVRNSESGGFETLICTRLFRVVCCNGALVECEGEQAFSVAGAAGPPADWQSRVATVVRRSFDAVSLKLDFRRFEATADQMVVTPYEFLCSLAAQQLITDEEQSEIQSAFDENADFTMYGLINAVTQTAHEHRASDRWLRAFEIERLAGEILRGDHTLPAFDRVYAG